MTNNLGIRSVFPARPHLAPLLVYSQPKGLKVTLISLLAASLFAESMGFPAEDLTTNKSKNIFSQWLKGNCQPNYRKVGNTGVCMCVWDASRDCLNDEKTVLRCLERRHVFIPDQCSLSWVTLRLPFSASLLLLNTETLYYTSWQWSALFQTKPATSLITSVSLDLVSSQRHLLQFFPPLIWLRGIEAIKYFL